MKNGCVGCKYRSLRNGWCNYGDITGRSRLAMGGKIHPNGGCDLYEAGETVIRRQPMMYVRAKEKDTAKTEYQRQREARHRQIATNYKAGLCDTEIAKTVGVNVETVANWRKRYGLESNYVKKRRLMKKGLGDGKKS